jgi:DNA polymerase-3 subunit alpha
MYDLEVACDTHNFILANGIITSNSHSAAYGLVSYQTAYLKAHFPEEFFVCSLNVANEAKDHEQIESLERDVRNFEINLLPRKLNTCDVEYKIVRKKDAITGVARSEIMPSIMCKGVGYAAAKSIADNKPYKDLRELSAKTDSKLIGVEILGALIDAGFFNEYMKKHSVKGQKKLDKVTLIEQYTRIREDLKKAARIGVVSTDMFANFK